MENDLTATDWRERRSFRAGQFPLERLLAAKRVRRGRAAGT
jgi:hypothetical protein